MKILIRLFTAIGISLIVSQTAFAQGDADTGSEDIINFELRFGAFVVDRDTDLGLSTDMFGGTRFDFESDLGADPSTTVFRIDGLYRFNKHHRLDFGWFALNRGATRAIDRELTIGDQVFAIDTTLDSTLNIDIFKAAYTYVFPIGENSELGLTAGLFAVKAAASFAATNFGQVAADSLTIPLPVIGFRARHSFTPRFHANVSFETFFLTIGKYDGNLIDARFELEYDFFRNVGVGVAVNLIDIDVDVDNDVIDWQIDWKTRGVLLYMKVFF